MHQTFIESASFNLSQISDAIGQMRNEEYLEKLELLSGSSIGMHVRHIVEFYECFLDGNNSGHIDYDKRKRNIQIEENNDFANDIIEHIIHELNSLRVIDNLDLSSAQSIFNLSSITMKTNTLRELSYLIEHTIHHMAILKIALRHHCPNIKLSNHFGVAYSTIKHQELVHGNLSSS